MSNRSTTAILGSKFGRLLSQIRALGRSGPPAPPGGTIRARGRQAAEEPVVELNRILIILARSGQGGAEPVRLLTSRMSSRTVYFTTMGWLPTDSVLKVRILLAEGCCLDGEATVVSLESRGEGAAGQLDLRCPPEHLPLLRSYLKKLAANR
ncbi:MAG TPA: hypothetical protein VNO81_09680 [Candidatus Nitrosotenuis sp.]|jgi:hypothetical protein|nr:hypothetical protein [Candidatus Nitrosotenuis sp.]